MILDKQNLVAAVQEYSLSLPKTFVYVSDSEKIVPQQITEGVRNYSNIFVKASCQVSYLAQCREREINSNSKELQNSSDRRQNR